MKKKTSGSTKPIYSFMLVWIVLSLFLPMQKLWAILITAGVSAITAWLVSVSENRKSAENAGKRDAFSCKDVPVRKSYGPEIDPILDEGQRALGEMGRLYMSIKDHDVRKKINELMRITDKITQDAIADPSDIPQIKKFLNYYLPTTIKLLNAYDRMSAQGIEGENLNRSMDSINEMLDAAIEAFRKRLDSLFANQALDIETDIEVMNTMLAREGLSGEKDFKVQASDGSQTQVQQKG